MEVLSTPRMVSINTAQSNEFVLQTTAYEKSIRESSITPDKALVFPKLKFQL